MNYVLVRYSEIAKKSEPVRSRMIDVLRQRVEDRLKYEESDFDAVRETPGRILVEGAGEKVAKKISELPGVSSTSPAVKTSSSIEKIIEASEKLEVGESFGVDANRSGEHSFNSEDIGRKVGAAVQERTGAEVNLDDPETWIGVDVRHEATYLFDQKFEGSGGLPTGSSESLAVLISGGIDSPVAGHEVMKRGSDIVPIYFYNKPVAAEDHYLRFRSVVEKLEKFSPSRDWKAYVVDMEEINNILMEEIGKGRMIVHRRIMFRVAERIAKEEGLEGLVTGEALAQKSSQTPSNLRKTSEVTEIPVLRPLLSHSKDEIVSKAREIGTFEDAKIASACKSMVPDSPATRIREEELKRLENKVDVEELVDTASENIDVVKF